MLGLGFGLGYGGMVGVRFTELGFGLGSGLGLD